MKKEVKALFYKPGGVCFLAGMCLLPFFYIVYQTYSEKKLLDEAKEQFMELNFSAQKWLLNREQKKQFIGTFAASDMYFLDHKIETLLLLQPEIEKLQVIREHPGIAGCDELNQRFAFLTGNANKMLFTQTAKAEGPFFLESEEKQMHAVEMSMDDLKKVLSLIERVSISPYTYSPDCPQLIIKEFDLTKKMILGDREVFNIQMELIRRVVKNHTQTTSKIELSAAPKPNSSI